jgi:hypothetical protein
MLPSRDPYTSGPQRPVHPSSQWAGSTLTFGAGIGGLALFGRARFGNQRGYDYYIRAARAIEEYSPGKILRTFQVSQLLSPLESASRQYRYFSPSIIADIQQSASGKAWLGYMSKLTGRDLVSPEEEIMRRGFRYEGGSLLFGRTGEDVLLKYASVIRNPVGAEPRFQTAYARSLAGGPWNIRNAFLERIPHISRERRIGEEVFGFIGGQTRGQVARRYISGFGTSLIERLNQLARAPFELPVISSIAKKLPFRFGVTPSSGLKTLASLTWKLGILAPAAVLGYQQLDYHAKQAEVLDNTILAEGITAGAGTIWARSQTSISRIAESLGLHEYREAQEEIAPGSTSIQKLITFPILGGLGGVGLGYAHRLYEQIGWQVRGGFGAHEASLAADTTREMFLKRAGSTFREDILGVVSPEIRDLAGKRTARMGESWFGRLAGRIVQQQSKPGILGRLARIVGRPTPSSVLGWSGVALGTALIAPFIPGALLPSTRPEELEKIYSGEQEVPIRRGRMWEFGRQPYEGGRIDRFRPHWLPRMIAGGKDISLYGKDISPLEKWWKENFTYDIERAQYYDRPYPVTSPAFSEVPLLGPLLGATIGKLIKPQRIMHPDEWIGTNPSGEEKYLRMPLRYGQREEIAELGEAEPGAPVSPYDVKGVVGEQFYNLSEAVGLPGFVATSIKERLTGSPDLFDEEMQLAAAGRMYSSRRGYWDLDLGGLAGTSEIVRRLYPHERRQIPKYNPLVNTMPSWLPGEGEKAVNFQIGDPYTAIPEGEIRLPGPGFAAIHPEMRGVDPEDYPDLWRLKILSDIAPYSDKYGKTLGRVRASRARGELDEQEEEMYRTILNQVKQRKTRKEFSPYKYRERVSTPSEIALARANEESKEPKSDSWFARTIGSYWETLAHGAETPLEYLTPISPAAKLLHTRTAVEDYERTQLYGTESAFWQHPIRDFLRPFVSSTAHALGWEGIPGEVQTRRDIEEYFDILKYVKQTRLRNIAREEGDEEALVEAEEKRRETLFGVNPFTHNYTQIFRALPRSDRDYFNEFVKADMEEREEILGMIPENEKALYIARWKLEDVTNWRRAIKKDVLTDEEEAQAREEISDLYEERSTEGFPIDEELREQWIRTRMAGESYADWYRRVKLLPGKLRGRVLPGPDWVGFNPLISLEDIKLKVVQGMGGDTFAYDLWPEQIRAASRRPYLEGAAEELEGSMSQQEVRERVLNILSDHGISPTSVSTKPIFGSSSHKLDLTLREDRSSDIRQEIRKGMN